MRSSLSLLLLVTSIGAISGLTTSSSAAPYIVYSGTATGLAASASGSVKVSNPVYLLTDLGDTSNFAILQFDISKKVYTVISRPSDTPPTDEASDNFFSGIIASNGKTGVGALSYSTIETDSSNNTLIARAYATGALTLKSTALVAARPKALTVTLKSNGVATGTYTFLPTTAISSGASAYPKALVGTFNNYELTASGALGHLSSGGAISFAENPTLTTLANVGGAYTLGRNTAAILPVSIPAGTSAADSFAAWLSAFAQTNGYALPSSGSSPSVADDTSLSLGSSLSLSLGGAISIGTLSEGYTGSVLFDSGTLSFAKATGGSSNVFVSSANNGLLVVGATPGVLSGALTSTDYSYSGNQGATLYLLNSNITSGTPGSGGTLSIGGSGTLFGSASIAQTVTITSENADGTLNGFLTLASSTTSPVPAAAVRFSDMNVVVANTSSVNVTGPHAGDVLTCNLSITGSLTTNNQTSPPTFSYAGGTLTITNVTSDTNFTATTGTGN